ncbi:MAG: hypothetical protein Q9M40_07835 [Sulfurimonas sp.]|nr:hypothetical protein [Sulfurimonas sp.]
MSFPKFTEEYSLLAWRPSDMVSLKMLKQLSQDKDFDVAQAATEELDKRR